MRIYLVRHGQTDLNIQKRMQGRTGLPLNEVGRAQAEALAQELKDVRFDAVFSSPQERAVETAKIASGGMTPVTDERLQPFDVGSADGQVIDETMHLTVGLIPDSRYYDGVEDPRAFRERIRAFMDELVGKYAGRDANVMIAGHKCTTGCIDCYFNGMPADGNFFSRSVKNGKCRVYELDGKGKQTRP